MARPVKESLSYFPLDTGFFGDRKTKRLLKTFGGKGTTIFIFLLCDVYRENGYFLKWDEFYAEDIACTLGSGFSESLVLEVLSLCLKVGLLNEDLFSRLSILTSVAIQKRYISAKETINKRRYEPAQLLLPDYDLLTPLNSVNGCITPKTGVIPLKGNESKYSSSKKITTKLSKFEIRDEPTGIIDASELLNDKCVGQPITTLTGKVTATTNDIQAFLSVLGSIQTNEVEKMHISKAIDQGCTAEHLQQLLKEKPKITSLKSDWVLRELLAVKRRMEEQSPTILDQLEAEYGGQL